MKLKAVLCLVFCILGLEVVSGYAREGRKPRHKTTVAAPEEDQYDVRYVKIDLSATNLSTAISGSSITKAVVVAPLMSEYFFELSNQLTIDSAKIDGQAITVNTVNTYLRKAVLPAVLTQGDGFEVEVFYHGAPTGGTGFFTNGILHQTIASVPVQVTHTVSAAYHSRDWFPCKQSLTDKIDSADVWITVDDTLAVAGNGLLQTITPMGSGKHRYEWSTRYLADYYLLSFAVAPYVEYNYYMHFSNSTDSMLIQNFIYNTPSVLQQHQDELDSIGHIVDYFSAIFGRYPFDKEKFGICQMPLGGGMENQTMVSLGSLETTLIAHELAHQWWGDHVTCRTIKDMWLNEGWATYCEQLFLEHFHGPAVMQNERTGVFNTVINGLGTNGGSVYVDDTTNEFRVYDGRLTYYKGSAVAHMLRYMINNDSLFFATLKQYQQQFAFGNASTSNLRDIAESVSGTDLDTFFNQWVYLEGYPTYAIKWTQDASHQVVLKITQTTSKPASVPVFKIPVEIKLTSAQGDTVVRLDNEHPVQFYSFGWGRTMTGLVVDPYDNILNKTGAITNDPNIVNVAAQEPGVIHIFPNPSSSGWRITDLPVLSFLSLKDLTGREVWHSQLAGSEVFIPSDSLVSGAYMLTITSRDGQVLTRKLLK